jgi:putative transposase
MPYRGDVFAPGHIYHLYNRAVTGECLFLTPGNYEHCLRLVKRYAPRYRVTVIAYCLMPNHYHLLVRQESDAPLSRFVNVLFNAYVQAVNRQRYRRGPLFEGRFKHIWVDRGEYLIHLCRYIHLNPVKAGLAAQPDGWPYSNYLEWLDRRAGSLKDAAFIHQHFPTSEAYRLFVADAEDEARQHECLQKYVWD